jgi:translocation and assembly module TamB
MAKPTNRWMRYLTRLLLGVLLLVILLPTLLIGLLWSDSGSRWLAFFAAEQSGGVLTLEDVRGNFLERIELLGVRIEQGELQLALDQASLSWRPMALFDATLHIQSLALKGIDLSPPPPQDPPAESPPPIELPDAIELPLRVQIDEILIEDTQLLGGENPQRLDRLALSLSGNEEEIVIHSLQLAAPGITLDVEGKMASRSPFPLELDARWGFQQPDLDPFEGAARLAGDLDELTLNHQLLGPFRIDTQASVRQPLTSADWQATLSASELSWPASGGEGAIHISNPRIELKGNLAEAQGQITLAHQGMGIPPGQWSLQLTANQQRIEIQQLRGEILDGVVELKGDYQIPEQLAGVQFAARGLVPALAAEGLEETLGEARIDLSGKAKLAGERLEIEGLQLELPGQAQVALVGSLSQLSSGNPGLDLRLAWQQLRWPLQGELIQVSSQSGEVKLTGTPKAYTLVLTSQLHGDAIPKSGWRLVGEGSDTALDIRELKGQLPAGTLSGNAAVAWSPELSTRFELFGDQVHLAELVPEWDDQAPADLEIKGQLAGNAFELTTLNVELPALESRLQATASGKLDRGDGQPVITAQASWSELRWPLAADLPALINSPDGELDFNGTPKAYQTTLAAELYGQDIPHGKWIIDGSGSDQQFDIASLTGETLGGTLTGDGQVQWVPALKWQMNLQGQGINPGEQWLELPGSLAFNLTSSGTMADDNLLAALQLGPVEGSLRGYPVHLQATARSTAAGYELQQLSLASNNNHIEADAKLIGEQLQARWQIDLPAINELLPSGRGRLSGQGSISGPVSAPAIQGELTGKGVAYAGTMLDALELELDIDPLGSERVHMILNAGPLSQEDEPVMRSATLRADGVIGQHAIQLEGDIDQQHQLSLAMNGGFDLANNSWRGQLAEIELETGQFGDWRSDGPVMLALSAEQIALARLCLRREGDAAICSALDWAAESGTDLSASLQGLALGWLNPDLDAELEGEIRAKVGATGSILADADIRISEGEIRVPIEGGQKGLAHRGGQIKTHIDSQGLVTELELGLLEQGRLTGSFAMPGLSQLPPAAEQPLRGSFKANITDINIITAFVPALDSASGELDADLTLAGTLENPELEGRLIGKQMGAKLPDLGITLSDIELQAITEPDNPALWNLELNAGSGGGTLALSGQLDILEQQASIRLEGDRFQVIKTADVRATLSPALDITASPTGIHSRGRITLPSVSITPQISVVDMVGANLASAGNAPPPNPDAAQLPSADVVVIGEEREKEKPLAQEMKTELELDTQVDVVLGEKVFVDTVGFRSQIEGAVHLSHDPRNDDIIPIANGEIRIVDGTYRSFGQDLEIALGRLLFSNVPAHQPEIDVRAVRRINGDPQVSLAGIHITGDPEKLDLRLFSEPEIDQSSVMSYILTGSAPGNSNQTVGLGTYIRPDLYVGYDIDLLDNSGAFNLRYQIKHNFGVEAEVGESDNVITFSYVLEK